MKLIFVFMLGLFLCTSLAAKEEKTDTYDEDTKDLMKVDQFYLGGKYFVFLFLEPDQITFRCFLGKIRENETKICCEISRAKACCFFPFLEDFKDAHMSPKISF